VVVRLGHNRRIGWLIKTLQAQVGQFLRSCEWPVSRSIVVQEGPFEMGTEKSCFDQVSNAVPIQPLASRSIDCAMPAARMISKR
jgi:hypothetical protein